MSIAEKDPARRLEACYAGWPTGELEDLAARADVLVTATGAAEVVARLVGDAGA